MDICTVTQFRDSLSSPHTLLRTQHNILFEPDTLCCSKHFAEARATIEHRSVMLYAPITYQSADIARTAQKAMRSVDGVLGDMQILEKEILYSGLLSGKCCMIVESIPPGIPLSEAIYTLSRSHLLLGLNKLRSQLKFCDLSHNYLNIYNITVDSNYTWHTFRNVYVTRGYGNDTTIFKELEECINRCSLPDYSTTVDHEQLLRNSIVRDNDGMTIYPIKESRRRFITPNGVGFQDRDGKVIIEDIYSWASDFEENRAVVRLMDGTMGIINRKGEYIIEPRYTDLEYDSYNGITTAYNGAQRIRFDYLGQVMEE